MSYAEVEELTEVIADFKRRKADDPSLVVIDHNRSPIIATSLRNSRAFCSSPRSARKGEDKITKRHGEDSAGGQSFSTNENRINLQIKFLLTTSRQAAAGRLNYHELYDHRIS